MKVDKRQNRTYHLFGKEKVTRCGWPAFYQFFVRIAGQLTELLAFFLIFLTPNVSHFREYLA